MKHKQGAADMRPATVFLNAALLLLAASSPSARGEECGDQRNSVARLTMDSRRNDSGHWVSQVELVHGDAGERMGDPWTVDVHQRASSCGGATSGRSAARRNGFVVVGARLVSPRPERAGVESATEAEVEAGAGAEAADVPSGEEVRFGQRYSSGLRLSLTELPWQQAQRVCEAHGQVLVNVTQASPRELHLLMLFQAVEMAWVGLRRSVDAGHVFVDLSGHTLVTSESGWVKNRPMATGLLAEEACGAILLDGQLTDVLCKNPLPFFCY